MVERNENNWNNYIQKCKLIGFYLFFYSLIRNFAPKYGY